MPSIRTLKRDSTGDLPAYAWPGGYPIGYHDREGSVLCPACANASDRDDELPQFRPAEFFILYDQDECDYCEQCSRRLWAI